MEESEKNKKLDSLTQSGPAEMPYVVAISIHGFKVMMVGFTIAAISALVLITQHDHNSIAKTACLWTGFSGFGIYVIGRILVSIQRRARKKYLQSLPRSGEDTE